MKYFVSSAERHFSTLIAVVEVLRMNPDSYVIIYDSKYDNNDDVFDNTMDTTAGEQYHHLPPVPLPLCHIKTTITMNTVKDL